MHLSSKLHPLLPHLFLSLCFFSLAHAQPFRPPPGVCTSCFSPPGSTYSNDFGLISQHAPAAVFNPRTPQDISLLLMSISNSSAYDTITVGPNGARHSTYGQAEVEGGVVVDMRSLPRYIKVDAANKYVDADGGALWVEVLEETLKSGLAPRSWTDYLYLTVGGTLSVGGISGQMFRHGPQIVNVLELDVVTGKGEIVTCSEGKQAELFYGVLGGMGQFGIISRARISLDVAPKMARRVLVTYTEFDRFSSHQELLIQMTEPDYIEGQVAPSSSGTGGVDYIIELAFYYNQGDPIQQRVDAVLSRLGSTGSTTDLSYFDFLNRVKQEEDELRKKGLWEVRHPWLNVFVPRSQISQFTGLLVETITQKPVNGPLLLYPFFTNKWNPKMSTVLPEDVSGKNTAYVIGILRSTDLSCTPESECMRYLLALNTKLVGASVGGMGGKLYLPNWKGEADWIAHFGAKWEGFKQLKDRYDPLHLLAPGLRIFERRPR